MLNNDNNKLPSETGIKNKNEMDGTIITMRFYFTIRVRLNILTTNFEDSMKLGKKLIITITSTANYAGSTDNRKYVYRVIRVTSYPRTNINSFVGVCRANMLKAKL